MCLCLSVFNFLLFFSFLSFLQHNINNVTAKRECRHTNTKQLMYLPSKIEKLRPWEKSWSPWFHYFTKEKSNSLLNCCSLTDRESPKLSVVPTNLFERYLFSLVSLKTSSSSLCSWTETNESEKKINSFVFLCYLFIRRDRKVTNTHASLKFVPSPFDVISIRVSVGLPRRTPVAEIGYSREGWVSEKTIDEIDARSPPIGDRAVRGKSLCCDATAGRREKFTVFDVDFRV